MINVDISNVWTCLSLPELLGCEQQVFDAHNRLWNGEEDGPDFMRWLQIPAAAEKRLLQRVREVAGIVCDQSELLLVCGSGGTYHGAKAAVEALGTGGPQILFVGQSLSSRQAAELSDLLREKDYSLLIVSHDGKDVAVNVTVRSLRWMMERKYGDEAKSRIYAATTVGSALHTMAQEEGYELFPLPKQLGGSHTTLTPGALVPMAAAGIDPEAVMAGAAQAGELLELRAFENPAWLYAAVQHAMTGKGRDRELLCLTDPCLQGVGQWLQRQNLRQGGSLSVQTVLLPGDLEAMDSVAACGAPVFETVLRFEQTGRRIPVEMDWKDYDGLGALYGKNLEDVDEALLRAMIESHNSAGIPIVEIGCGPRCAESFGAMVRFFELSAALTGCLQGHAPFAVPETAAGEAALEKLIGM